MKREDFLERIRSEVLVGWPALHTMLADWGKDLESHLSEWVIRHPREFQDALRQSYAAGSDIGVTATQASNPFRAKPFGIDDRIFELNYYSAKLAKEVTPKNHYLCGHISSSNPDFLEPVGNMTVDEVYEGYERQVVALIEGGVDLFSVGGTQLDVQVVIIKVIKDLTDFPIIAASVFFKGKKGFRTMMGIDPETASRRLQEAGADVVGFTCGLLTQSPHASDWYPEASNLIGEIRKGYKGYMTVRPDAGVAQLIKGETVYPATPDDLAKVVPDWIDAGVRIIGGCCGTSLEHIKAISAVVKAKKQ